MGIACRYFINIFLEPVCLGSSNIQGRIPVEAEVSPFALGDVISQMLTEGQLQLVQLAISTMINSEIG